MYAHPRHRLADEDAWAALAAFDRAAILVAETPNGPQAVHAPLALEGRKLVGHVARANPIWRAAPARALVICQGPEAYISPGWYETKRQTGRAVPTWAYETLHAEGRLTTFEDRDRLRLLVARLSDRHEEGRPAPWAITDAPGDYIDALLGAIVGVEIEITALAGKRKLGQERIAADRAGMIDGLTASPDPRDAAVADAMRRAAEAEAQG